MAAVVAVEVGTMACSCHLRPHDIPTQRPLVIPSWECVDPVMSSAVAAEAPSHHSLPSASLASMMLTQILVMVLTVNLFGMVMTLEHVS
jgi:hypothetical protein